MWKRLAKRLPAIASEFLIAALFVGVLTCLVWLVVGSYQRFVRWSDPNVQAAIISSLALLASVLVSYHAFIRTPRHLKTLEFRLQYVERQMSELYGPLLGRLKSTQEAYNAALRTLGFTEADIRAVDSGETWLDPYLFFDEKFVGTEEGRIVDRFTADYFLPANEAIRQLITAKYDLVGPRRRYRPKSFETFLEHEAEFLVRFKRWEQSRNSDTRPGVRWPPQLRIDVENKLELLALLQSKYRRLIEGRGMLHDREQEIAALKAKLDQTKHEPIEPSRNLEFPCSRS